MDHRPLGHSGVEVSRIILGCGNVGGIGSAPAFVGMGENEEEGHALMDAAWAVGVTCFDTADVYGAGQSEAAIGSWMRSRGHPALVATKVFHSPGGDPADRGLAPERIRRAVDSSLRRLGVECIDLYLIHRPDPCTPVVETLEVLDELVRAGKVGAIGACNVDAGYLEEALRISRERRLARFEWVQNPFNLLARGAERDVLPVCVREGLGFTPYAPLAGGWLTGKYRRGEPYPPRSRMTIWPGPWSHLENKRTFAGLERLGAAAKDRGVEIATLALAWVLTHPHVTAAIAGPRRPEQLEPLAAAFDLELTQAERDGLAALFKPRRLARLRRGR